MRRVPSRLIISQGAQAQNGLQNQIQYKNRFCLGVHRKIDKTVIIHINNTAIKVYIPHKEMSLSCFLSVSCSKNVVLASYDVLVSGVYSWEFLVRVCRPVPQILTLFQNKNVIFHTRFQTWSLKSIPVSELRNYVIITLIRTATTTTKLKSENLIFRNRVFLFLSYSFRIETTNTFIHSCSSLEETGIKKF